MLLNECRSLRVSPGTVPEYHHCTPLVTHMSTMKVFNKRVSSRHIRAVTSLSWYQKMVKNSIFQWFLLKCRLFQNVKTSYIYFPFFFSEHDTSHSVVSICGEFVEFIQFNNREKSGNWIRVSSWCCIYSKRREPGIGALVQNRTAGPVRCCNFLKRRGSGIGPQDRSDTITFKIHSVSESDPRTGPMQ